MCYSSLGVDTVRVRPTRVSKSSMRLNRVGLYVQCSCQLTLVYQSHRVHWVIILIRPMLVECLDPVTSRAMALPNWSWSAAALHVSPPPCFFCRIGRFCRRCKLFWRATCSYAVERLWHGLSSVVICPSICNGCTVAKRCEIGPRYWSLIGSRIFHDIGCQMTRISSTLDDLNSKGSAATETV